MAPLLPAIISRRPATVSSFRGLGIKLPLIQIALALTFESTPIHGRRHKGAGFRADVACYAQTQKTGPSCPGAHSAGDESRLVGSFLWRPNNTTRTRLSL